LITAAHPSTEEIMPRRGAAGGRALVTGHRGFVGRHLVPELLEAGYAVTGTEDMIPFLDDPPHGFDVIVHCAANIVNVEARMKIGMRAFDDIALDAAMCRYVEKNPPTQMFVAMSSCAVDFPRDPYCTVKRTLEAFAETLISQEKPVTVLRPFSGYGGDQSEEYPFMAILNRVKRAARGGSDPVVVWGGDQVRDWLHIDDLVSAVIHAVRGGFGKGKTVEIGTGTGTSLKDLARLLCLEYGVDPGRIKCDHSKAVTSQFRVANPELARLLGWRSRISLESGIARTV
jgi:nucleoside-diphosphate-sugar epimerase